jgi:hypothetical protein
MVLPEKKFEWCQSVASDERILAEQKSDDARIAELTTKGWKRISGYERYVPEPKPLDIMAETRKMLR